MRVGGTALFGLAAALLAAPGTAHAADDVDCMAVSYSAEDRAEIAALSNDFSMEENVGSGDDLAQIGIKATYRCFEEHDWSEDELYFAMLFELGRLSEAAYRQSGHLTADQLRLFDKALAATDRTDLWAVMERAVAAGMENREAETTPREDLMMGGFVIAAGLGADASEKVGTLLGFMALQRLGRREFDALGAKE